MNKNVLIPCLSAILWSVAIHPISAETPSPAGFRGLIGYRSMDISQYSFAHDTHPQDAFLPGATTPGSAGTTSLDSRLNLMALGIGYQVPVASRLLFNVDVGGLFGDERDRIKNLNDTRPDPDAAFVYSQARWGLFAAAGLSYVLSRALYAGLEAQVAGIFIESGWDRYSQDESQQTTFELYPSIGPKVGVSFSDRFGIEGTVQFGRSTNFGINGVLRF